MLATVAFHSEALAKVVFPAVEPSFVLSPLSYSLSMFVPLVPLTPCFVSFFFEPLAGFLNVESLNRTGVLPFLSGHSSKK